MPKGKPNAREPQITLMSSKGNHMATKEQLRELITAQPFVPFVIRMNGGRVFTVRHPENASCDRKGRGLWVHDDTVTHQAEMLLVEVMKPVDSTASGNRP
jgi:hypothetical protein